MISQLKGCKHSYYDENPGGNESFMLINIAHKQLTTFFVYVPSQSCAMAQQQNCGYNLILLPYFSSSALQLANNTTSTITTKIYWCWSRFQQNYYYLLLLNVIHMATLQSQSSDCAIVQASIAQSDTSAVIVNR